MWHAFVEEANRAVSKASEIVLNENKRNMLMIHKQLTKSFESEHVMLAQISDLDSVTFDLEDQVRQSNKECWFSMR